MYNSAIFQLSDFGVAAESILNRHNFVAKLHYFIRISKNMWLTSARCCKMGLFRGQYGLFCGENAAFLPFAVEFAVIEEFVLSILK